MDTLDEITKGYQSTFERMDTMPIQKLLLKENKQMKTLNEITEDMMHEDGSSYFTTKDMELERLKACIGEYVPHPYSAAYLEMVTSGDYELDDEVIVDTETTEDMMHEDGSSYFTTKDMEAEYDRIGVSCKDCPDDECTGHCMSCCYR